MKKLLLVLYFALNGLLLTAVHGGEARINKVWETTDDLQAPESVIFDEKRNVLYVSNINGGPMDKDDNGFIARVSLQGEIIELKWFTDPLWAPKGMAIANDHLYVADISKVVEVDLETGQLVKVYTVADAVFLNDVAADQQGNIYISDMMTNTIHRIKNGQIEPWLKSERLASPNGLTVVKDSLVVGSWGVMDGEGFATSVPGHLLTISLGDKTIADLGGSGPTGNLDGVEMTESGDFLVTDWMAGKLLLVNKDGQVENLLDLEQGSADHEYIESSRLILIPMMKNNKLLAYEFKL